MADDILVSMGVSASTGRPLSLFDDSAVASMLNGSDPKSTIEGFSGKRSDEDQISYALTGDAEADDLSQAGWGIVYAASVSQAVKEALSPLIRRRESEAKPFKIYDGPDAVQPGESCEDWLSRHDVSWTHVVNPDKGVPYYLLLVGSPTDIPFEFQYTLDLQWAVGRLWFETPEEFARYSSSLLKYEDATKIDNDRSVAMFAPEHDFDNATQLFIRHVAKQLRDGEGADPVPLGRRQRFALHTILGDQASKSALSELFSGRSPAKRPSILFTGSHGMQFDNGDVRQKDCQGAIVCRDWEGYDEIKDSHWFSAADLSKDAQIHGLFHFFFACHGGGCSQFDDFDRLNGSPKRIAAEPFLSLLPQRMLTHPNGGALGVLAHVERAWAYSFLGSNRSSQPQGFRDVLARLMKGDRIGHATDVFNQRWAALSIDLAQLHLNKQLHPDLPLRDLGKMWVARDDARNFIVLGDPAARLRVKDRDLGDSPST
jgi:hypothetical protein